MRPQEGQHTCDIDHQCFWTSYIMLIKQGKPYHVGSLHK